MTCLWRNVLPLRTPGWPTPQLGNLSGSRFLIETTLFLGNCQDKARGSSQDKPTLSSLPTPSWFAAQPRSGGKSREQREQVTISGSRAGSRGLSSSAAQRREHQPSTIPPFPAPNHPLTTEAGVTPFVPPGPADEGTGCTCVTCCWGSTWSAGACWGSPTPAHPPSGDPALAPAGLAGYLGASGEVSPEQWWPASLGCLTLC